MAQKEGSFISRLTCNTRETTVSLIYNNALNTPGFLSFYYLLMSSSSSYTTERTMWQVITSKLVTSRKGGQHHSSLLLVIEQLYHDVKFGTPSGLAEDSTQGHWLLSILLSENLPHACHKSSFPVQFLALISKTPMHLQNTTINETSEQGKADTHTHKHTHTTHTHTCTCIQTHTHTQTHTPHTHTHTCTCIQTHTHTHIHTDTLVSLVKQVTKEYNLKYCK